MLAPMNPPPADGLRVFCACCGAAVAGAEAWCDLSAPAGTYYCPACAPGEHCTDCGRKRECYLICGAPVCEDCAEELGDIHDAGCL